MTADHEFDPAGVLDQIAAASEHLFDTVARFSDADVRGPSLLPGWSRGHVLTHLARNADGGSHLLVWARTGVETPEYPSMAARAEQIEAGAGRSANALLADIRDSAARFAAEYARMPTAAWGRVVRWTGGHERPAARAADSRLCEVLVHHVDLCAGYTAAQWPATFTEDMLRRVVASFNGRSDSPAMRLHATDGDAWYEVGRAHDIQTIHGSKASLLAWLMGRTKATDLTTQDGAALPEPPFLY
jgi:maleylpyruvate isomerase